MSEQTLDGKGLGRRRLLVAGIGTVGGVIVGPGTGLLGRERAAALPAEPGPLRPASRMTENGWPAVAETPAHVVEGCGAEVRLLAGDVATVLLHVARRYHYELWELEQPDLVGHIASATSGAPFESNHRSGTALAIRPTSFPLHVSGGYYPHELIVVRDILADCEGVVTWGGDQSPAKESHFQIAVAPGDPALARVAAKIRGWNAQSDVGAGATDPLAPGRRAAATALEAQQAA